jgi:hypothetical protein
MLLRYELKTSLNQVRKDYPHPVFINEDLTQPIAKLFYAARKLVKDKLIYKAWTSQGRVYFKASDSPSCKPKLVLSTADLPSQSD